MSLYFKAATHAFDAWMSKRCAEAFASEARKSWPNAPPETRAMVAQGRLANFLSGPLAAAQAAGDEEAVDIEDCDFDFAEIADKWLRPIAENDATS